MKKVISRLLSMCLTLSMLLTAFTGVITVEAVTADSIFTNLYEWGGDGLPSASSVDVTDYVKGYYSSTAIPVQKGDVIYFGPYDTTEKTYIFAPYQADGTRAGGRVYTTSTNITECFQTADGLSFFSYTVPNNAVVSVRVVVLEAQLNDFLVTKNQEVTAETYAAWLDAKDVPDFNNLYEWGGDGLPSASSVDVTDYVKGYYSSKAISVSKGDVICFGPYDTSSTPYIFAPYGSDGVRAGGRVTTASDKLTECFQTEDGLSFFTYTVPNTAVVSVRIVAMEAQLNDFLITKNQEVTAEAYAKWVAYKNGSEELVEIENLYYPNAIATPNPTTKGGSVAGTTNVAYASSRPWEVSEGDVIYFGPTSTNAGRPEVWVTYDAQGNGTSITVDATEHVKLTNGASIMKWTVPVGVSYMAVGVDRANVSTFTVTKNQAFGESDWRAHVAKYDPDANVIARPNSPLKDEKILFMGDSIMYGSYDMLPTSKGRSWAGRIAVATGATVKNVGVGGSTVALDATSKGDLMDQWEAAMSEDSDYTMVFIHSTVNDVKNANIQMGSMLYTNDPAILKANAHTFAGGLQWTLYNIRQSMPEQTVIYCTNINKLAGYEGIGNMDRIWDYYALAMQICNYYHVEFIDLYHNEEINDLLQPDTTKYLADLLHPDSEGYDILYPYVLDAMEQIVLKRDMLYVYYQLNGKGDVRLVTTVDSLNYTKVTFQITNSYGDIANVDITRAYTSILAGEGVEAIVDPKTVGNELSEYFVALNLLGCGGETFTVRIIVTNADGSTVSGASRTITA